MWAVDADTVITNPTITLESLIAKSLAAKPKEKEDGNIDFIASVDENTVNTGSFFIRRSDWSVAFLKEVYRTNQKDVPDINRWWEQAAMIHVLNETDSMMNHVLFVDQEWFNAYRDKLEGGRLPLSCRRPWLCVGEKT